MWSSTASRSIHSHSRSPTPATPIIASPVSFFLAAVPGTGYKLYRSTNSGGSGASLSKTTISSPFSKPSRAVNQPGTTATVDSSDGTITGAPYFDGTLIWFAHDGDDDGFPTVRYGAVDTRNDTVATVWAFHSGNSDDFNPSITVGITPSGETGNSSWAFTHSVAGTATTPVFASGSASQPIQTIAGAGAPSTPPVAALPASVRTTATPPKILRADSVISPPCRSTPRLTAVLLPRNNIWHQNGRHASRPLVSAKGMRRG